ncbi:nucleoside/nucleotide kinase family protein [Cellulomonas gilvus]|uniref:GCN5-related N-acetyltransferase n=1 Tax=Cellulomonas gilvus (strain ATCC 13127 / NRRL B-14078) TaxID=593907 RepID=F8A7V5_CELGA|nr:nucleoside/nucleotide kinase family protein [Cellulomonas gilvus]AEI13638.1 GCN5-related N-acetyltransferase [Cellulomonas gilvus ATCC 13127]
MPDRADVADLDLLAARVRALHGAAGRRVVVGIAGSPGAGKTTLAESLVRALGGRAAHVPMDGFHLANATLDALGRRDRKGAPDTFDAWGFVALLRRVRDETAHTVYAPGFRREVDEPVAAEVAVEPGHEVVVVEGNYLLVADEPWGRVRDLLDEAWFVATPSDERERRLVERHVRHGRTEHAALAWARDVDGRNAALVEATASRADLVVVGGRDDEAALAAGRTAGMTPRPAGPGDVAAVHALRRDLEEWMAERGIDQWPVGSLPRERVAAQVAAGQWWVVEDDEGVLATVRVVPADPEYWGEDTTPALYVHGLMVARRAGGRGLGRALVEWAHARAQRAGAVWLRLDHRASNPHLDALYRSWGFEAVGESERPGFRVVLMQRACAAG